MAVGTTSSTVAMLVHQQDSFGVSAQGTCDKIQWQSGSLICMYKYIHIQTS